MSPRNRLNFRNALWLPFAVLIYFASNYCLAVSVGGAKVFYLDNDVATLNQQTLDGSTPQVIAATRPAAIGLAIDVSAAKLYWSDNGFSGDGTARAQIHRSNLDGSGQEILYTASSPNSVETVGQIQLDLQAHQVYWSGRELIRRMNMDGTGVATVATVPFLSSALELDPVNHQLYFSFGGPGISSSRIERMNFDGSGRTPIANVLAYSLALDVTNQKIYVADYFDSLLMEVGFDGTELTQLAKVNAIRDVQVYGGQLYYPNYRSVAPDNTGPYFFQWVRANLDGSNPVVLYEVPSPSAQSPRNLIQFVIIPEPPAVVSSILAVAMCALGRKRRYLVS